MESKVMVEPRITLNRFESKLAANFHLEGVFSLLGFVAFSSFLFVLELLGFSVTASLFGVNSLSSIRFICNIQRR